MNKYVNGLFIVLALPFIFTYSGDAFSQDTSDTVQTSAEKLDLYLDCDYCPRNYIKSNITFVNYVRDRIDAEVQLILTSDRTGGGGRKFTLQFYGRNDFSGHNDTLSYFSPETETQDLMRQGLVKQIKIGLMSYVANTDISDRINISYKKTEDQDQKQKRNRWNNWMFELSSHFSANGSESRKSFSYYGSGRAEKITKKWKIRFNLNTDYDWNKFSFNNQPDRITTRISHGYHSLIAKSLTDHWSLGVYSNARRSTFNNLDFSAGISPALEYNVFPYSEYNSREFSFRYRLTPKYNNYEEETIYFKQDEYLVRQVGSMRMEFTQPWGEVDLEVVGSHYMHDLDKNRLSFNGSVEFQITKGLSFDLYGRYSIINDQLSLARGEATKEEVYLRLRQLATSYSYYGRLGISYSFGAIYNNIVNPRF